MISVSGKFTPAAFTLTTTCPLPAFSEGTSSTTSFSGGPNSLHSTAFICSRLISSDHTLGFT